MARTLQQIITELNKADQPRVKRAQEQKQGVAKQLEADEKGLGARQKGAFDDILAGARRRGLGFSGIPLGEQADYTADVYLPELARLRQGAQQRRGSLEDFILGIGSENRKQAQGLRQSELDREEQRRQFDAQLAAQRRAQAAQNRQFDLFGQQLEAANQNTEFNLADLPGISQKGKDGSAGFAFQVGNTPVSAAGYADRNNVDLGVLLNSMRNKGDVFAGRVYDYLDSGGDINQARVLFPQIFRDPSTYGNRGSREQRLAALRNTGRSPQQIRSNVNTSRTFNTGVRY